METILVKGRFHTGHRQRNHQGKCRFLHGHTWRGEFVLRAERFPRDELDMAIDFSALKDIMKGMDHKFLVTDADRDLVECGAVDPEGFVSIDGRSASVENVTYYCLGKIIDLLRTKYPGHGITYDVKVTIQETDNNFFIVDETVTV